MIRLGYLIARSASSVGLALKSSCPMSHVCVFVCCNRFGLNSAWPTAAQRSRLAVFDQNGPVSNRLSHKDIQDGGGPKITNFRQKCTIFKSFIA